MELLKTLVKNQKEYQRILNPMEQDLIIVDDDGILMVILQKMFEKVNPELKIGTFLKGEEALMYILESNFPKPPFLMVDLFLQDISGWEILEKLDEDGRFESKVVLITSSVESGNSAQSSRFKCVSGYYEKPITLEKIRIIDQMIIGNRN